MPTVASRTLPPDAQRCRTAGSLHRWRAPRRRRARARGVSLAALLALSAFPAMSPAAAAAAQRRGTQARPTGQTPTALVPGFRADRRAELRAVEARLLALPDATRCEAAHRFLTAEPHVAGTPRDRELAEWVRDRWIEAGLEDVEIVRHDVLLSYPEEVTVELVAPVRWRASLREDPVPADPDTYHPDVGIPHHAYSASGEAVAEVVYANSGNPEDYDRLLEMGIEIRGRIALVRYSVPYSYRGFKALTAQRRGAAGILIYSDPEDDGHLKGDTFPDGPWGPSSHIQRGGITYDFFVPGDPLTPGWPSLPGAPRIETSEARPLPRILSAPLSWRDAQEILRRLEGPAAPEEWQGGLPFRYRVGPGPARVRMRIRMREPVTPIWTVVARVRGAEAPEETVVLGNHRDAWIFGGCDPSSGTATMTEVARAFGTLLREGRRPKRTIVLASWDAEEFSLTSSTEWGEQYADELRRHGVAYLNVDASACGPNLSVNASPSLNAFLAAAVRDVPDPAGGSLLDAWRARNDGTAPLVGNRLGSGSDYTVFLNFLGMPIVDWTFEGPYGVYHSVYDGHYWIARIGDPGFRYHAAMAQLTAIAAWRLADADLLPYDYAEYARVVAGFVDEIAAAARDAGAPDLGLDGLRGAVEAWRTAGARLNEARDRALRQGRPDPGGWREANRRLLEVERQLLHPDGIPGRPWFRQLVYAPRFTYAPEVLPGVAEAVRDRDWARARVQVGRLQDAIDRARAKTLDAAALLAAGPTR